MERRAFLAGMVAMMAAPLAVEAQPAGRVYRVGFLSAEPPPTQAVPAIGLDSLRKALRELGYIEGQSLHLEYRWAGGSGLPEVVADLLRLKLDVVVTWATPLVLAIQRESRTVPIVCALCTDLVKGGAVKSLAKPDSNATGLTAIGPELMAKRLEILKQLGMSKAVIIHPLPHDHPIAVAWQREAEPAAQRLGLTIETAAPTPAEDVERRFVTAAREKGTACMVMESPRYLAHRRQIGELGVRHRVPTMFMFREHVASGGLVSYGVNIDDFFRRAATYVDRLLKGAVPGDLPVEQPTRFELIINTRTARALGLTIPQSLLLRADQVIE